MADVTDEEPMPSEVGYGTAALVPAGGIPASSRFEYDLPVVGQARPLHSAALTAAREQRAREATLGAIVRDLAASRPWAETPTGWVMCGLCGCEIAYPEDPRPDEHDPDCVWRRARWATT